MKTNEKPNQYKKNCAAVQNTMAGKIIITAYNPKAKIQTTTKYNVIHKLEQSKGKW